MRVGHIARIRAGHQQAAGQIRRSADHQRRAQRHGQLAGGLLHIVAAHGDVAAAGTEHAAIRHAAADGLGAAQRAGRADADAGGQRLGDQRAALHLGQAGVARRLRQVERTRTLQDQAACTGNRIVPAGAAGEANGDVAPVELLRPVDRLADIQFAVAERRVRLRAAERIGGTEQRLPHQVVAEIRIGLPHQRRCTRHLRGGHRGALHDEVAGAGRGVIRTADDHVARRGQAIVHRDAALVGIAVQLSGAGAVERDHGEPALFQVRRETGQRGDRAGIGR